jgi:membrane protein
MNAVKRLLDAVDKAQQGHPWLAIPVATWKKFGDDQAGNLAALISYYAFASIFPLLLVAVTVLDIVLKNNNALRLRLLGALRDYPVIGTVVVGHVKGLDRTGLALVIGLVLTFLGARGVASAMQNAQNSVWEVPMLRRPGFPWGVLRSVGLIGVLGPGVIITIVLSTLAGGAGHVVSGVLATVLATVVSLVLNVGLFWLAFRIGTASEVATRDLRLSAILAAVTWQILQSLGGYFITHQLHSNSAYGIFGVVLGLLAWFYLQAQITLYAVELNVVRVHRLWPRSLVPPPLTDADVAAYRLYARAGQRRAEIEVDIQQADPDTGHTEPEAGDAKPAPAEPAAPAAGSTDSPAAGTDSAGAGNDSAGARNGSSTAGTTGPGRGNPAADQAGASARPGRDRRQSPLRQYATRAIRRIRRR